MIPPRLNRREACFSEARWTGVAGRAFAWANRKDYPAPYFRKEFELGSIPKNATLSVAAGGYIEVWLNGKKVEDHVLDPTPSVFDKHVFYIEFNVTQYLLPGRNTIGVILGNSTYNCSTDGPWMLDKIVWRDYPKFLLQLNADGNCLVASGLNWQSFTDGPIRMDAVKNGEFYDANFELGDWSVSGYDSSSWKNAGIVHGPGGELKKQQQPPCRKLARLALNPIGNNVYDCGQNLTGYAQIRVRGNKGAVITIRYSEKVDLSGKIDRTGIEHFVTSGEFQTDRYSLKGSEEECWNPRFAYHGFRYAEITIQGEAELLKANAIFIATDFERIGKCNSSSEDLNKLLQNAVWTWQSNFTGIPTDCPSREKQGWTGDALLGTETGLYNFDAADGYADWLTSVIDTQRPSGQIAAKAPISSGGYNWGYGPAWDSALVMIPDMIYNFTGRTDLIERCYPAIQKYIDFCMEMSPGLFAGFGLGDWFCDKLFETASPALITTGYVYADVILAAKFALLLNKPDDAAYYSSLASDIRTAYRKQFLNENGSYGNETQTALAAPLFFGLAENNEKTASLLNERAIQDHYQARFGIQGAKFVPRMLAEYGYIDSAYEIITQPEYPGWIWQLRQGATTLWEHWNGGESRNHIMFGDFDAWCFRYPGGFRFHNGNLTIQPMFPKKLNSFTCSHRGFQTTWQRISGRIDLQILIPEGKQADVLIKNEKRKLFPGTHSFQITI